MSVTALSITTDSNEYCRYAVGQNVITVLATVSSGTMTAGDTFLVEIKRPSGASWPEAKRTVMSKIITITSSNVQSNSFSAIFTLGVDDVDIDGIARCITNIYDVTITNNNNNLLSWTLASAFHVVLVSCLEIRKQWCYGAPLRTTEIMGPKFQPKKISGVTIDEVSPDTVPGMKTLTYTVNNGIKSIAWDGGDVSVIGTLKEQYLLMDEFDMQYITVTIDPNKLPASSVAERILIVQGEMQDFLIRGRIHNAIDGVESALGFALEPYYYTSVPLYPGQTQAHANQTDHWDRIGRPADYVVPVDGYQWPNFRLPYQWCLKLHNLWGYHSVDKIIEIEGDWFNTTIDRMSGLVMLIPALSSFARWTVYTHPMLAPFFMHRNIASFWQYNATFGLPNLHEEGRGSAREMVARTAAVSVLIEAGRGYQGGIGSEMTSRDGLTNSRNYNPGGPYAPTIMQHQQWLQAETPRIKQKLGGVQMGMLGAS